MIVSTQGSVRGVVLAGGGFGLVGVVSCLVVMRNSLVWERAMVVGFAMVAASAAVSGGFCWWAGRGCSTAPAWRTAMIGLLTVLLAYPLWVFLYGLHKGHDYSFGPVMIYTGVLLLISWPYTFPAGLLASFAIRKILASWLKPGAVSPAKSIAVHPPASSHLEFPQERSEATGSAQVSRTSV